MRLLATCAARWRRVLLAAVLPALGACPQSPGLAPYPTTFAGAPFSQADLVGDWDYVAIFHGSTVAAGTSRGWERGTLRVGAGGDVTVLSALASDGLTNSTVPTQWTIDADGFVTAPPGTEVGFDLKLNAARTLAAATGSAGPVTVPVAAFWIFHRVASPSSSDLAGSTWTYHRLTTGSSPSWEHGLATFDSARVLSYTGRVASQGGTQQNQPSVGTAALDGSGRVTLDSDTSFGGSLSADRNLLVATRTPLGSGPQFALEVYVRLGQTFTWADLTGRVSSHTIVAGPSGASGWSHGVSTVSETGHQTFESSLTNAGQTTLPAPADLSLAPDGTVTVPLLPTIHGTELYSKDGSVKTSTTGTGIVYASFGMNLR
jgi:hypothetical protein